MIIKGGSCKGAGRIAAHLSRTDQNERAEVAELRGVIGGDLRAALREMETAALCSRTRKVFYHASINPRAHERMGAAQWVEATDRLETALGFSGQPRAVIEHVKDGRAHRHIVWLRIELAKARAISDSHNFRKHEQCARDLERAFGFARVQGVHVERDGRQRPARTPSHDEMQQAARSGRDLAAFKAELTELWRTTESGLAFVGALSARGYLLAKGDRRDFVIIDRAGTAHSLARRIDGATAKDIRARLAGIDRDGLPSVAEARAMQRARAEIAKPVARATRRKTKTPRAKSTATASAGLYVTVSRKRLDYARPCLQAGANTNGPPNWTPAQIVRIGEFLAQARMSTLPVVTPRLEQFAAPVRPVTAGEAIDNGAESAEAGGDDGLGALLAAIAADVQGRAASARAALRGKFKGDVAHARRTLPPDQIGAAIEALRQALAAALKAVKEAAAREIEGKQKAASVQWRRRHLSTITGGRGPAGQNPDVK